MLLFVLLQYGLTKQITERGSKRPRHVREHIKPANLPLVTLNFAQPALSMTHQVSEKNLRQSTTTPVEAIRSQMLSRSHAPLTSPRYQQRPPCPPASSPTHSRLDRTRGGNRHYVCAEPDRHAAVPQKPLTRDQLPRVGGGAATGCASGHSTRRCAAQAGHVG
jgi:hypothetical protein